MRPTVYIVAPDATSATHAVDLAVALGRSRQEIQVVETPHDIQKHGGLKRGDIVVEEAGWRGMHPSRDVLAPLLNPDALKANGVKWMRIPLDENSSLDLERALAILEE